MAGLTNQPYVLVLYYSRFGATADMAEQVAEGVNKVAGIRALVRTVPPVSDNLQQRSDPVPDAGPLYCKKEELRHCSGLILGSPTRFGNMAAPLKYFLDGSGDIWMSGDLIDKPAAVFGSTSSMHGGNEATLLTMMLPLLHHGMLVCGLPYSLPELHTTTAGGTPYGASHVSGQRGDRPISEDETALCKALGQRIARLTKQLYSGEVSD